MSAPAPAPVSSPAGGPPAGLFAAAGAWARSFPPQVWSLFLGHLCSSMGAAFYFPMLTIFLREELSISMSWIGTMFLGAGLLGALGAWMGGVGCDRFGRKPIMILALLGRGFFSAVLALLAWRHGSVPLVVAAFLASSFLGHFFGPAGDAYMADVVPVHQRVQGYGLIRVAKNFGWAVGPLMSGFLALFSYSLLFTVTAVAMSVGAWVIHAFATEPARSGARERLHWRDVLAVGRDGRFLAFCGGCMLLFSVMAQLVATLSDWSLEHVRITKPQMGVVYAINGTIVVLFQIPMARYLARVRLSTALAAGSAIYAFAYGSMAFTHGFGAIAGLMVFITTAEITASPSAVSLAANLSPADARGRYLGVFGLFHQLGWSLGPWVGGLALDGFAPHSERAWFLLGGFGLAACAAFAALSAWIPRTFDRPETNEPAGE